MQCVDCHFEVDVHGNGLLYGEPRNATTITCVDCHGTINSRPRPRSTAQSSCSPPARAASLTRRIAKDRAGGFDEKLDAVEAALRVGRRHAFPKLHDVAGHPMGGAADDRRHQSALRALQRQGALREDAPARRRDVGRGSRFREKCRAQARARQREHGLPDLPHLVGDELFRLPPADEGESARRRRTSSKE